MWNKLPIKAKLPLAVVSFSLAVGIGVGAGSYWRAATTVESLTEERLLAIATERTKELELYFESIERDLRITAASPVAVDALTSFTQTFHALGDEATQRLQTAYIEANPHPLGSKHLLDAGSTEPGYDEVHRRFHPWFRKLLKEREYYDVFLFDADGHLVYSVFKEADFATGFAAGGGRWADTDLGAAFRAARAAAADEIAFFDFRPYAPSADAPASFISTPVVADGETIGVLAFQMPVGAVNALMASRSGLGETGEAIIVGPDGLLRSDSSFSEVNDILSTRITSAPAEAALAGSTSVAVVDGYRGTQTLQAAVPFAFHGTEWAVLAAQEVTEIRAPLATLRTTMLVIGFVLFAVAALGVLLAPALLSRTLPDALETAVALPIAVAALLGVGVAAATRVGPAALRRALADLGPDIAEAFFARGVWAAQIALSVVIVSSYIAVFALAGASLGADVPALAWITIAPLVLVSMLIPVSIGGWGVREGAAAALFPLAGVDASIGLAIAILYGLTSLAGSLPGLALLFLRRRR